MFSLITTILGFITGLGPSIAQITNKIADLQLAKVQASSNLEKQKIDQQIEEAHDRRDVLVAEAGQRINAYIRALLAIGPTAFVLKVFFWDKVLGSLVGCSGATGVLIEACKTFRTDPIDPTLGIVLSAVIAFYFLYDMKAKSRQ